MTSLVAPKIGRQFGGSVYVDQAAARFQAMGLEWRAAETRALAGSAMH